MISARNVVARFQTAYAVFSDRWDGKFLGKDARLRWNRNGWLLEELPQKGKKKLRRANFDEFSRRGWQGFNAYIPGNILREAKLGSSDDYDKIKKKLSEAFKEAAEVTISKMPPEQIEKSPNRWAWLRESKWSEDQVHYLKIEPEGTDPFVAEGKDFNVNVRWTGFSAYSPQSDFQQADPHYTEYESTSPAAARKLYQILKADPTALKNISWGQFDGFLKKHKINYRTNFSVWH